MKKPKLNFWQIWNMSFGFLGIQFGFALQNANVSRIFQTLGAQMDDIAGLWIAAPITGLIIQPIIGYASDKTWGRFGRRRPYFFVGALLASIALFLMPNSPVLWMAAGMLWIMDASINISMEPFRAFVGDMLPDEQRTKGFAMQSFFIGTGAVLGSVLPWVLTNWMGLENTAPEGIVPPSVKWSFYIGGAVFFSSILVTVFKTKEYSPAQLDEFDEHKTSAQTPEVVNEVSTPVGKFLILGGFFGLLGLATLLLTYFYELDKMLYVLGGMLTLFFLLMLFVIFLVKNKRTNNGLVEVFDDMMSMPKTMRQLAVVQFFTWLALFAMWIYSTGAITEHIYGTTDTKSALYNEGANWVGVLFGVYNGVAAAFAFLLPVIARATNRKITHSISLVFGGIGLLSIFFIKDHYWLIASMVGVGIAWASILSMPYAILTGSLPARKMGVYMGIFNYFIVLPQILAATILGFLVKNLFHDQAVYALVLGGISMVLAAVMVLFVEDKN